jgi:hypothetical protein
VEVLPHECVKRASRKLVQYKVNNSYIYCSDGGNENIWEKLPVSFSHNHSQIILKKRNNQPTKIRGNGIYRIDGSEILTNFHYFSALGMKDVKDSVKV